MAASHPKEKLSPRFNPDSPSPIHIGRPETTPPKRTYRAGTTTMFRAVELKRPKRMTMAIGAWISLPGCPTDSARGISANPAANAVMRIGISRSLAPRLTASMELATPSDSTRLLMCAINITLLRVAMPNRVMNPMMEATDNTPPGQRQMADSDACVNPERMGYTPRPYYTFCLGRLPDKCS